MKDSSFANWQRIVSMVLVSVIALNTGLFSGVAHAQTFEVKLDDFRNESPEDSREYGLVNVLVESALLDDRLLNGHVRRYCERIQEILGAVCLITPWEGQTPSRILEALQQLYFEGYEVDDGIAKLIGLVVVGEVPLPVVHNEQDSFPSFFPYTDLVNPAYVFDSRQGRFVSSTALTEQPQAELWHGLIRPPGEGEDRLEHLRTYFEKNEAFYQEDQLFTVFDNQIGFHDQYWENDSFDNETKKWYLKKMSLLDRIMNYRYNGEWLQELSGEAVDRLAKLTARTFDDSSVQVERTQSDDADDDLGFDPEQAKSQANASIGKVSKGNEDVDDYGEGRLQETVPDSYSPGPIRNFLKDYVHVVNRYVSGTAELLDQAGRRQSYETLASLITKMDKFESSIVYLVTQEFEKYLYEQAKQMAMDFELVQRFEEKNDFYSEEATAFLQEAQKKLAGDKNVPLGIEAKPKSGPFEYGSKVFDRFVNGRFVRDIQSVDECSIERGTNFLSDAGEPGRAVTLNRKDNPLTTQDISGVSGRKAKEEIEQVYKAAGYCSYMVKDRCVPGAAKVPLLDFAASEEFDGDYDYRRCFDHDGPRIPEDIDSAQFHTIPSIVNHNEPRGETVRAMLEKKLAHYFPLDAVRHVSFFLGGAGQYSDENVARLEYPNFFEMNISDRAALIETLREEVEKKEMELRKLRVESNWKRYAQYLAYSTPVPGRGDFWNYNEISGFNGRFQQYKTEAVQLMRPELDPSGQMEDFEVVEQYLIGTSVSPETEEKIQTLLTDYFPTAFAQQSLALQCEYTFEVPPVDFKVEVPKFDPSDLMAFDFTGFEFPKFNPPSISRACENKTAKNTLDVVKSLRSFYFSLGGVKVDMAFLHNSDKFVEVLDPIAVLLYYTPPPPNLPPNTNQLAAIHLFEQQVDKLVNQPPKAITYHSRTIKPVLLQPQGELVDIFSRHAEKLQEALRWLNLSIEGKHKEGLSLLAKDKEMLYLVMNGDAEHLDFTLSQLSGSFELDADEGISSSSDILDKVRDGEKDLQQKLEEARKKRELERRISGEKPSKCGDSVPLLEWPEAVSCWLDEIISGPLIVPAEDDKDSSAANGSELSKAEGTPGEIVLSRSVLTLRDRATASIQLPDELEVQWSAAGSVRIVPEQNGKVSVVPTETGVGSVRATIHDGSGPRVLTAEVKVVDLHAVLRQVTTGDFAIGSDDELSFEVEIRNADEKPVKFNTSLQVFVGNGSVMSPGVVQVQEGKGHFSIKPGKQSGLASLSVGSPEVARSAEIFVNPIAGSPAEVVWDFGDRVIGLDREIQGVLSLKDDFGNAYRSEGLRVDLRWDDRLVVNGKSGGTGTFFIIAGELPLTIRVSDDFYEQQELQSEALGYGYLSEELFEEIIFTRLPLKVEKVDGYPELRLPADVFFDTDPSYRVHVMDLPDQIAVGELVPIKIQVAGSQGVLNLNKKKFRLQKEFAGGVETFEIPMQSALGNFMVYSGASAGTMRLIIDDPDFGSVEKSIQVLGQTAERFSMEGAQYTNGEVQFTLSGIDAYGNPSLLPQKIAFVRIVGHGGEVLHEKSSVIEDGILEYQALLLRQPDRIRLEVSVEGFDQNVSEVLPLRQVLTADDVRNLSWQTPYLMLGGGTFGDYRVNDSVAQALLYSESSRIQAITTEMAPHYSPEQVARVWPSGRTTVGPDVKVEVIWQNLKPVLVYSDTDREIGRLTLNPRGLPLEVQTRPDGSFLWEKSNDRRKAVLVPEQASFVASDSGSGVLMSPQGEELISFQNNQLVFNDPSIQTSVFDDSGDVLVLEFSRQQQVLARWYLHFEVFEVGMDGTGLLQWQFTGSQQDYESRFFYAGEGTLDERGLVLLKKGNSVRTSVGQGRSALDDVRENNGQGFFGQDKSALSFLAGNSVGESTFLQSEGIVNLGDPLISLRQVRRRNSSGEVVPALPENSRDAASDFSIGQLVYAPEDGEIIELQRLDVEGDGDDDLAVVLKKGQQTIVRYLEGNGQGSRWGKVSDLLNLGKGVKKIQVLQNRSFVILYQSGQVVIQQNIQGKYVPQMMDFAELKKTSPIISNLEVRDFDLDGFGDLLFLSGDRELWVWYGSQTLDGLQFGVRENDRQLLKVLSVRLEDPEKLRSAAWVMTSGTPSLLTDCEQNSLACKSQYFRSYEGALGLESAEEPDRLQQLIDQSQVKPVFEVPALEAQTQNFLVRLDQLPSLKNFVNIELLSAQEGTALAVGRKLDFEVTINPVRKEERFVLRYDLGADFSLPGSVACDGCSQKLKVLRTADSLWSLEGTLEAGKVITLQFSVEYQALPDFSFQVMKTNADDFFDIGINVSANTSGQITVFESRAPRQYAEIIFGQLASSGQSSPATDTLMDVMRGIGLEGKSKEDIKKLLLEQQQQVEASAGDLFDQAHQDNNADGYPDLYQENPSLLPEVSVPGPQASSSLFDIFSSLIPGAKAQSSGTFGSGTEDFFSNLENADQMVQNIAADVEMLVKSLKCSRGCLPLPMNFAFLAPGPINIFGEPAGFDPGLPVFGVSPAPFFIWPPLVPYQATQFRIYLSPTLTLGLGMAVCLGPYLLGQCMAFSLPLQQLGGEALCDAAKQGLSTLMQNIYTVVGQVSAAVDEVKGQLDKTGVIKARNSQRSIDEAEGFIGVSLGGGVHKEGINPLEAKVFLQPIPKIFVDWWDRQWEEVINSLTDLPDITVRLPDLSNAFGDREYFDKLSEKVTGETFINLQQLYDLINSLPVVNLNPKVLKIQIPWIEPGMLRRIEQSLYEFLFNFTLEMIAFLRSFNLPCNITVVRSEYFQEMRKRVKAGRSEQAEKEIQRLKDQLEDRNSDLVQTQKEFLQFSEAEGFAQETVEFRRAYFAELEEKRTQVNLLNAQYQDLENQIQRLEQPQKIIDILPVFNDVAQQTLRFWTQQYQSFREASLPDALNRETATALRSCVALKVGVDVSADVSGFVDGIKKNLEALETWKRFPRELAKYLNVLEFYTQEIIKIIDQLTSVVLKWWSEFEKKLDLWIDVIFAYEEFIALIKLILDILKGYNKKCGLCTSDRLTLKELILKILFGVVPKFPIIDFPTWPDIRLDFSEVDLSLDVAVPVFDVRTVDLKWPELPKITFPRFEDLNISAIGDLSLNVSVTLPDVPLVIPPPPVLPPLPPLPNIPKINLPNLPPAPEVPQILEGLLPLMKIIQTILDIWCLVNKALVPIDEKVLKTQIENLTNRSLHLILPIDLLLEFDVLPGDLLSSLVPFDTIDVKTTFQAGVKVDPLPDLQKTIDQQFHQPMNALLQQIDAWIDGLKKSGEQGLGTFQGELQDIVDEFSLEAGVELKSRTNVDINLERDFSELINVVPRPTIHSQMIEHRRQEIASTQSTLKSHFESLGSSLAEMTREAPEDLLSRLARMDSGNVLVTGGQNLLKQQLSEEKRTALYAPENMVEKRISLLQKQPLLAQLDQTRSTFETLQEQMLGSETAGVEQWGTAIVRDGEARRIQDYPLNDPAVAVWDNDVFLGYEKALYLKSLDGSARRTSTYEGRPQQVSLDSLQRSAISHLRVQPLSGANSLGASSVRWSWESLGEEDVELTIWDTVGKAQRSASQHLRFYLHPESDQTAGYFQAITPGVTLQEGQEVLTRREIRLRFGEDQVILPAGMQFTIPSFVSRSLKVQGDGMVILENFSGEPWSLSLGDQSQFKMNGVAEMNAEGRQEVRIPAFTSRPYVTRISSDTAGALRKRVEISVGDVIPSGDLYVTRASRLNREGSETELRMSPGVVFSVTKNEKWNLLSGKAEVIVSDALEYTEGRMGMVLMDDELLKGSFMVDDDGVPLEILPEQQVVWSDVSSSTFEVTLSLGNYYGRIRARDGNRGFSQIVHAAAQPLHSEVQVVSGVEQMALPIYTSFEIDGKNFIIGNLSSESYHWRLQGEKLFSSGQVYRHPGFHTVGTRTVELFVRNGEEDFLAKTFEVSVFLPEVKLDEALFRETRVLRVQTQPPVPGLPIGIVGERGGVQDWLLANPSNGSRLENRYYTDESGVVQLPALEDLEGMNIVIEDGKKVARLYPNGRVVLNEEYKDTCQNDAILDVDGYLKFRISCVDKGQLLKKFEVRMVPDLDTDVSIVENFTSFDRGVTIRALQSSIELMPLSRESTFSPGSVQARIRNGAVLLVLSPDGTLELVQKDLSVVPKSFESPMDPLVWQVFQGGNVLLEFVIHGPDRVAVVDPEVREVVVGDEDGDGMLDRWEANYDIQNPSEDPDLDGLTNLQEFQKGTHPKKSDTDGDGLSDGDEVDPLSSESVQKKITFSDVSSKSPYYQAIQELSQFGFIQGYQDGTFKPDQAVTRAEALKIIMSAIRCENCETPSQATKEQHNPILKTLEQFLQFHGGLFADDPAAAVSSLAPEKLFSFDRSSLQSSDAKIGTYFDVSVEDWYYYCIEIATQLGLVNGYRGFENGENALGKFLPNRGVNVAELMKIVVEAIGESGKQSDRVYGPNDGWWNDPTKNYLAKAEEDLQLLISSEDYRDPLRQATRAEVVYAAWRVLKENGTLDFDEDGVANRTDQCPCQAGNSESPLPTNGCPATYGPVAPVRKREGLFSGIEITQLINCRCLVVIPADLFTGSTFFGVITGSGSESDKVYVKSNVVGGGG